MILLNEEPNFLKPVPQDFDIVELDDFKRDVKKLNLDSDDIEELKRAIKEQAPEASLGG